MGVDDYDFNWTLAHNASPHFNDFVMTISRLPLHPVLSGSY